MTLSQLPSPPCKVPENGVQRQDQSRILVDDLCHHRVEGGEMTVDILSLVLVIVITADDFIGPDDLEVEVVHVIQTIEKYFHQEEDQGAKTDITRRENVLCLEVQKDVKVIGHHHVVWIGVQEVLA